MLDDVAQQKGEVSDNSGNLMLAHRSRLHFGFYFFDGRQELQARKQLPSAEQVTVCVCPVPNGRFVHRIWQIPV